jgi:hypothetical protein
VALRLDLLAEARRLLDGEVPPAARPLAEETRAYLRRRSGED